MIILGIESSCDDFGVSVIKDSKVLSNIISSQIKEHSQFGGVVPELASRLHLKSCSIVYKEAIKKAHIKVSDIDYIGYTNNPGLIGSLIIGRLFAKTLSSIINKPAVALDHMRGHLASAFINTFPIYPVLTLVVSGGHTQLVLSKSIDDYKIIGESLDDAIGECLDKIGRKLDIPYPGGKIIDDYAEKSDEILFDFPNVNLENYDFSFSGIKTKAINYINKDKKHIENNINSFCNSLLNSCVKQLINKLDKAILEFKPKCISLAGGVSANKLLRNDIIKTGQKHNLKCFIPDLEFCTDNGAMIARLLELKLENRR